MRKLLMLLIALSLAIPSFGDDTPKEIAMRKLILDQKELIQAQDDLITKVTKQRNDLVKEEDKMPFYWWVVLGVAGGVILTRGIRN